MAPTARTAGGIELRLGIEILLRWRAWPAPRCGAADGRFGLQAGLVSVSRSGCSVASVDALADTLARGPRHAPVLVQPLACGGQTGVAPNALELHPILDFVCVAA
jgi:hypothetical protein